MTYSTEDDSRAHAPVVDDFNDDNQLDLAVVNSGINDVTIFQGYGNGSFISSESHSIGTDSLYLMQLLLVIIIMIIEWI